MTFIQPRRIATVKAITTTLPSKPGSQRVDFVQKAVTKYWQKRNEKWAAVKKKLEAMPAIIKDWKERRIAEREAIKSKKRPF